MSARIPVAEQVEHLRDTVSAFVAETPQGPAIVWCDTEGDWHSTRVPNEDDATDLPTYTTTYGIPAGVDPYDPESLEDVTAIPWADGDSPALALIAAERRTHPGRGYTSAHDAGHATELAAAAACYAIPTLTGRGLWPWDVAFWKPTPEDRVRELVKAGALIAAAIDATLGEVPRG